VAYEDRDITAEPSAREELHRLGYRVTPVLVIDGEIVVGFDPEKLKNLLGL